jgi:L-iditol 2-dehydrogenase
MAEGKVQTKPLITHEFEVTEWKKGFDTFEDRTGIKTLFYPAN